MIKQEEQYRVMIIEDVIGSLASLTRMVTELHYIAIPILHTQNLKDIIATESPSVILLDLALEPMSGFEICVMIRQSDKGREIPIIAVSGFAEEYYIAKAYELGVSDYIKKPILVQELERKLEVHVGYVKKKNEIEEKSHLLENVLAEKDKNLKLQHRNLIIALHAILNRNQIIEQERLTRIGENAKRLSEYLMLSKKYQKEITTEFIESIELTAPLYAIGKAYTENQQGSSNGYVLNGANMLFQLYEMDADNKYLRMAIDIAKYHRERYDGKGYPQRLEGEQIPLAARITAIINALDRIKRESGSNKQKEEKMITELEQESEGWLDPDILQIVHKIQNELL